MDRNTRQLFYLLSIQMPILFVSVAPYRIEHGSSPLTYEKKSLVLDMERRLTLAISHTGDTPRQEL
jgi:hypothetical protein